MKVQATFTTIMIAMKAQSTFPACHMDYVVGAPRML